MNSLDEIDDEFRLVKLVNVMVRIVYAGDIKMTNNNLTLKEYISDDREFQMKIAMFEQFTDQMELSNTYKI